eukprot:922531-Lingulodinium_polyedra.AAC.1
MASSARPAFASASPRRCAPVRMLRRCWREMGVSDLTHQADGHGGIDDGSPRKGDAILGSV